MSERKNVKRNKTRPKTEQAGKNQTMMFKRNNERKNLKPDEIRLMSMGLY